MENFFKQLLAQILTYIVFVMLMLFTFACLMTGEFPPRKESVKAQYQVLLEIKNNAGPILKMAAEKLRAGKPAEPNAKNANSIAELSNAEEFKALMKLQHSPQDLEEVRQEQARLKKQLDFIVQQNNEILKLLNKK